MLSISTYFSLSYLLFLLAVVGVYSCVSKNVRRWVLLISSYLFFMAVSGWLVGYLWGTTLIAYYFARRILAVQNEQAAHIKQVEKEKKKEITAFYQKKQTRLVMIAVGLQVGILVFLKYTPFAVANVNGLLHLLRVPFSLNIPKFFIPIGISFYTLQAASYVFDVYRKKLVADNNLLRVAMYMSFFPQIMEGPICRYADTAERLWEVEDISSSRMLIGMQRMLYGLAKKMVIADRLNLFIQNVFSNYNNAAYNGGVIALAAICYTLQLYMDFSGTMDVVIGSAQIFGVRLPENFQRPFFSATISEFWKRWHITLGTWFKDYVFYPLSMSKKMKKLTSAARKKWGNHYGPLVVGGMSLFVVWLLNGLWHGAGWNYIFFGMYHFVLILSGSLIDPVMVAWTQKLNIKRSSFPYRCLQIVRTGLLVCLGELFFRAHGLFAAFKMVEKIITSFSLSSILDGSLFTFGMDRYDYVVILVAVGCIFIISLLQEKGIRIRVALAQRSIWTQVCVGYALLLIIIIFGAYGVGYVPVDPIYAGF